MQVISAQTSICAESRVSNTAHKNTASQKARTSTNSRQWSCNLTFPAWFFSTGCALCKPPQPLLQKHLLEPARHWSTEFSWWPTNACRRSAEYCPPAPSWALGTRTWATGHLASDTGFGSISGKTKGQQAASLMRSPLLPKSRLEELTLP